MSSEDIRTRLVERLREHARWSAENNIPVGPVNEAADRIEELEEAMEAIKEYADTEDDTFLIWQTANGALASQTGRV